ncbi:MAG: carbon-nitrogen family hydrolase [Verrucomicrobiae bacterium]|nr:carbon-nitrogen family hydrolase [Verrucomicrobiae bacterium]
MRIFGVQFDMAWEDRAANYAKVESLLAAESIPAGSLIVLPEMFASGFSMNVDLIHEESPSETEAFLAELAGRYQSCVIGGLVGRSISGMGVNKLSVYGPNKELMGTYQKNHCFSFTGESDHYEPGTDILVFDWQGFSICPTICYDLRFPELYRRGVRAGANLFPVIASWPVDRIDHWDTLAKARAIENQAIVVAVNRIGKDPKWTYTGHTQVIDQQGKVLAKAVDEATCVSAEVSTEPLLEWRSRFKALQDMKEILPA